MNIDCMLRETNKMPFSFYENRNWLHNKEQGHHIISNTIGIVTPKLYRNSTIDY